MFALESKIPIMAIGVTVKRVEVGHHLFVLGADVAFTGFDSTCK